MSQKHVEWLLGRLTTDRDFRVRFYDDPAAMCAKESVELTERELAALLTLEQTRLEEFSKRLDPRIVRASVPSDRASVRRMTRLPESNPGRLRRAK